MIVLFNPTNELFEMMYGGIAMNLAPNSKRQVDDPCGKHLLNSHSTRGLCQLIYGDDEENVSKAGVKRNLEFKKNHVVRYNQINEQRKMQGLGYIPPTKELKDYSLELGIQLLEPYNVQDVTKSAIATLSEENALLKQQLTKIMEKLDKPSFDSPPGEPKAKRGRPKNEQLP